MIGTRLGQYRLDALLGQGGMGAVYQATDEMLDRQVAIKLLRHDVVDTPAAVERFRREAQVLARLDHPHILRLHGFSQHGDVLYMVTEFVTGQTLQRRLEAPEGVAPADAIRWLREVLAALQYAHDVGVVHRDIKPANILIDDRYRARLLDFGIARVVGHDGLTQTGHAVGTLSYMAPEQLLDHDTDRRTDLYALAVVACQMLSGRRPYRSATTAGLFREIVDGPPLDVAEILPAALAPMAPVITRGLARDPGDRFADADAFREALDQAWAQCHVSQTEATRVEPALNVDPSATVPVPPPAAPPSPRATIATAAVASAATVLVLAGGFWLLRDAPPQPGPDMATAATPTRGEAPAGETREGPATSAPAPAAPTAPSAPPSPPPVRGPAASSTPSTSPARPEPRATPPDAAVTSAPPPDAEPSAPEAAPRPAAGRTLLLVPDVLMLDHVDGEEEEFEGTLRLESSRLLLVDEDGETLKTVPYAAITRATYGTRKPGRFSLRRSPSHWVTLVTAPLPLELKVQPRRVETFLEALEARGVRVVRQ